MHRMKWLVGLDLEPSSRGAVIFARWLYEKATAQGNPVSIVGAHVLERRQIAPIFKLETPQQVTNRIQQAAQACIRTADATRAFESVEVVLDGRAEDGLQRELETQHATGIVVGRHRRADARATTRLGRTANRLLRTLPAPTIVVPNDLLSPSAIGPGPIIVGTDLELHSLTAFRFADAIGASVGRDVLICNVASDPHDTLEPYVTGRAIEDLTHDIKASAEGMLSAWLHVNEIEDGTTRVVQGRTVDALAHLAIELRSPLIVVGARGLSRLERVFVGSTSHELAATAPCPVAVVPHPR